MAVFGNRNLDSAETRQFIEAEVKPLWPKWTPSEPEITVWLDALEPFDFSTAKRMVQGYFGDDGARHARPRVKDLTKTRGRSPDCRAVRDLHTDVYVECVEADESAPGRLGQRKPIFATEGGKLTCDPDKVMLAAENARQKCESLYGGRWITVRTKAPVDDGLRGEDAKQKACERIRNGPDTPGKRWLLGKDKSKESLLHTVEK
jgi:hypothetical protein